MKEWRPNHIATQIIGDLRIALDRDFPVNGCPPFEWLAPGYGQNIRARILDRLILGYRSLPFERKALVKEAFHSALNRCATNWLGAEITLNLLDWIHAVAPEVISSHDFASLLFHRNSEDLRETSYWISQLVGRLDRWNINEAEIRRATHSKLVSQWSDLISSTSKDDRADVCYWIGKLLKEDSGIVNEILNNLSNNLSTKFLKEISSGKNISDDEAIRAFCIGAEIHGRKEILVAEEQTVFATLQVFVGNACDWPIHSELE